MSLTAFYHEAAVRVDDDTQLRLVIDFAALDAVEGLVGKPFDRILEDFTAADSDPPLGLQGKVIWGFLRRYHPEVSLDQVANLLFGPSSVALGVAIGQLFNAAFPTAEPDDGKKAKAANPRKPRGTSKPTS